MMAWETREKKNHRTGFFILRWFLGSNQHPPSGKNESKKEPIYLKGSSFVVIFSRPIVNPSPDAIRFMVVLRHYNIFVQLLAYTQNYVT
ncbi:hypothetical protein HP398_03390 [Brevibacillus sp. HB1.4B]|nr:hypothetical protein [Brevibacillus sp. HB1.4B]